MQASLYEEFDMTISIYHIVKSNLNHFVFTPVLLKQMTFRGGGGGGGQYH